MGTFAIIRPRDDADARLASDWADNLTAELTKNGHSRIVDVDDRAPADIANISAALSGSVDLICYFGHGDENSWLSYQSPTLDTTNVSAGNGKAIVSIACKTGCNLGPCANTAGITSWLGFTIKVAVIAPHKNVDPIGDAIVHGIARLGSWGTMQQARDQLATNFDQLVSDYDTGGRYNMHPGAGLGYYAAMSMRDHVVVHGQVNCQPLP